MNNQKPPNKEKNKTAQLNRSRTPLDNAQLLKKLRYNYNLINEENKTTHTSKHWQYYNQKFNQWLQKPEMWDNFRCNEISQGMDDANPNPNLIVPDNIQEVLEEFTRELLEVAGELSFILDEPPIGNPRTYSINGMKISAASIDFCYFAWRIFNIHGNDKNAEFLFLEIGSGFGGLTRALKLLMPKSKFILLDLPEGNTTASFFLQHAFPEARQHRYEELKTGQPLSWQEYDFAIWPGWCIEKICRHGIDFIINTRSLQEMSWDIIRYYFTHIESSQTRRPFLLCEQV
jgi:putative sugar O-methyltransferase